MPYDAQEARRAYESRDESRPEWTGVDVWEPGWYAARVLSVEPDAVSRQGNEMVVVTLGLIRHDGRRKKLVKGFVVDADANPTARRISYEKLGALAEAAGKEQPLEWIGADVMARLKYDSRGKSRTDEQGRVWELDNDVVGFKALSRKARADRDTHGDEAMAQVLEKEPEMSPQDMDDDIPFAFPLFYFGQSEGRPRWGAKW